MYGYSLLIQQLVSDLCHIHPHWVLMYEENIIASLLTTAWKVTTELYPHLRLF